MEDNSSSYIQLQRDDSGYGSPLLTHEFLSPQQSSSSSYYSYQHAYHTQNINYANNSFHMYDQFINPTNSYNSSLPIEQPTISRNTSPSKESTSSSSNPCPSYEYKINWVQPQGRRRRQRTVFTQGNVQQLDNVFMHNQYPDIELRETLAAQMGVPESRIQVRNCFVSL